MQAEQAIAASKHEIETINKRTEEEVKHEKEVGLSAIQVKKTQAQKAMQDTTKASEAKAKTIDDVSSAVVRKTSDKVEKAVLHIESQSAATIQEVETATASRVSRSDIAVLKDTERRNNVRYVADFKEKHIVEAADRQIRDVQAIHQSDVAMAEHKANEDAALGEKAAVDGANADVQNIQAKSASEIHRLKESQAAADAGLAKSTETVKVTTEQVKKIIADKEKADKKAKATDDGLAQEKQAKQAADAAVITAKANADFKMNEVQQEVSLSSKQNEETVRRTSLTVQRSSFADVQ
jgi:hypothetical protein